MFLFQGYEAHSRSIVKAASWRALGSIDTFVLGMIFTGQAGVAGAIAGTEVFTKIALYYFHERAWSAVKWGHQPPAASSTPEPTSTAPTAPPPPRTSAPERASDL